MITIMGGSGQVGSKLAKILLQQHCHVRLIARHAEKLVPLVAMGAEPAIGDVGDAKFLAQALKGADRLFFSVPPAFDSDDMIRDQDTLAASLTDIVAASGIKKIVNLSSVGADLAAGTGPIVVLHRQEQRLNALPALDVVHLRAAWFMENLLYRIGGIKSAGKMLYMIRPDVPMNAVATVDIAAVGAELLLHADFVGKSIRYLLGERTMTMSEMALVVGAAIAKPDLRYEQVPAEQITEALVAHGYSPNGASMFAQTADAFNKELLQKTVSRDASNTTPTSLERFAAEVFAPAYPGY